MVYGGQRTPDYEKCIVKLMLPTLQVEKFFTTLLKSRGDIGPDWGFLLTFAIPYNKIYLIALINDHYIL